MQFNVKITVIYTALNDYGEEQTVEEKTMRCCIVEDKLMQEKSKEGKKRYFDLKVIAPGRAFTPYADLFSKHETLLFKRDETVYEPVLIAAINDLSGKPKYYQLELMEVRNGSQT